MRWIFLLLPWIELFTLIQLGSEIGALATLVYVFATLMLGLTIVRFQGMEILDRLRAAQSRGIAVGGLLADDLAMGLGGLLLIIPGLVTDGLGALVFVGPLWRRLTGASRHPGALGSASYRDRGAFRDGAAPKAPGEALDCEFRRLDDE